jgi:hypothetical protein
MGRRVHLPKLTKDELAASDAACYEWALKEGLIQPPLTQQEKFAHSSDLEFARGRVLSSLEHLEFMEKYANEVIPHPVRQHSFMLAIKLATKNLRWVMNVLDAAAKAIRR